MNINFRANVKNVGYGHMKRCLSIAKEFASSGHLVKFYVDDLQVKELFPTKLIHFVLIEQENQFFSMIQNSSQSILIVDGHFADEAYVKVLKEYGRNHFVVVLDNLKQGLLGADLLVNPGLYAEEFYKNAQLKKYYLLGPKYTILDKEYKMVHPYDSTEVSNILITMGGMDPQNITQKLLKVLLNRYANIQFNVVVGNYFAYKNQIVQMSEQYANLNIFEGLSSLKNLIVKSDLCISSAGTTVFEMARCSKPVILFAQEENQLFSSRYWEKTKGVISFGYFDEAFSEKYIVAIEQLVQSKVKRKVIAKALADSSNYGTSLLVNDIIEKFNDWRRGKL